VHELGHAIENYRLGIKHFAGRSTVTDQPAVNKENSYRKAVGLPLRGDHQGRAVFCVSGDWTTEECWNILEPPSWHSEWKEWKRLSDEYRTNQR
jgi:hypothetical protein